MKVELRVDPSCKDVTVTVTAPAETPEVRDLLRRVRGEPEGRLLGFAGGRAVPLDPEEVLRFYADQKEVRAQTATGDFLVKQRLYELEGALDRHTFVRISHSEMVNLKKVTALDLKLSGTIKMTLEGGTACYVSRRYVKKIKEALGL